MPSFWNRLREVVPLPLLAALGVALGFQAFVAWDQSYWWRAKEDYGFGWLVPVFVGFVVYDRWSAIVAAVGACAAPGSPRATGVNRKLLAFAAGATLLVGVAFFLLGAFYRAGAGSSQPGTLAITLGMALLVPSLLWINMPDTPSPTAGSLRSDARVRLLGLFGFPILVWLVSAPMVSVVEQQVSLLLLRKVVTVVAFVFDVLGLPLEQRGNVLTLPTGNVGVEDACSGIRSLTGCLFAGSFLAAVFLDRLWQKVALIVAALLLAFVTNLFRSLFLTGWAYAYGPGAIEGLIHDVAGYAVLALTAGGLLCLLPLLKLGDRVAAPASRVPSQI